VISFILSCGASSLDKTEKLLDAKHEVWQAWRGTVVAHEQRSGCLRRKLKDGGFRASYCAQDPITSWTVTLQKSARILPDVLPYPADNPPAIISKRYE
jgi:hypothetical protein